jgi:expansin (peptidoglycan-binding protein)
MVRYGGIQQKAVVTDTCMGCDEGWIDVSNNFFSRFSGLVRGSLPIDWEFVDC